MKKFCLFTFIGFIAFFMMVVIAVCFSSKKDKAKVEAIQNAISEIPKDKLILSALDSLKGMNLDSIRTASDKGPAADVYTLQFFESLAIVHKSDSLKQVSDAAGKLYQHVSALKRKNFPIDRKQYAENLSKIYWENNIEVAASGPGNTIITFTGGSLANNANKKTVFEGVKEGLELLRFKQARFKWYSGDDEYTYWDIDSPKDNE